MYLCKVRTIGVVMTEIERCRGKDGAQITASEGCIFVSLSSHENEAGTNWEPR